MALKIEGTHLPPRVKIDRMLIEVKQTELDFWPARRRLVHVFVWFGSSIEDEIKDRTGVVAQMSFVGVSKECKLSARRESEIVWLLWFS